MGMLVACTPRSDAQVDLYCDKLSAPDPFESDGRSAAQGFKDVPTFFFSSSSSIAALPVLLFSL